MKKSLFRTQLASLLLLLLLPNISVAHDFEVNGIYYNIDGDKAIVTYKGTSYYNSADYSGEVSIPSSVTHDGTTYSVTSIGERAFYDCTGLTEITIPNSVTSIGHYAFYHCRGMTSITIPNSVTSIGQSAFTGCTGLTSITIPNSVTSIGSGAFSVCTGLTSITIPNSVTSIGQSAFSGCTGLTEITIPNSVTSIGQTAFSGCTGLTEITIPNSVTTIGQYAFDCCTGLKTVYFNAEDCNFQINLSHPFSNCPIERIVIGANVKKIPAYFASGLTGLTEITIPNSVTSIGSYAFSGCTGLTEITIPNSVTSIGSGAFYGCTGLTEINIQNSIIGSSMFYGCTGLTQVTIPNSVTSIGSGAFSGCTGLISINIQNSIIGESMFYGCTGLTEITIPNSVTSIGGSAFYGCTGLTNINIPNSVTSIGQSAFSGCTGLTEITIPNSVTSIGSNAFYNCTGLTEITIPNSVTSIGQSAFLGCTGLKTVYFNAENCSNPNYNNHSTFSNCPIERIVIGDNVKKIPGYFASGLTGLTEITIPNSVTSIGEHAFEGCTGLTSITIPNSVTSIGNSAFSDCTGLKTVYFNAENCGDFTSYNTFSNSPVERIVIGANVKKIPGNFANGLTGLTEITIPNSVTSIGGSAFSGCTGLTNITIPNSVTSIGGSAFSGCTGLTEFAIPNSITSIGSAAFKGCTGLSEITIPNSVTSIGSSAFSGCTGLKTVYFNAENCNDLNTYYPSYHPFYDCPIERIVIGANVKRIPAYFADALTGLTEITIPNSVTSVGANAFSGCTGLTNINIQNSIIGSYMFRGCTGLTEITIPNSVTSIGSSAFSGCTGLKTVYFNAENCGDFTSYNTFSNSPVERIVIGANVKKIPAYFASGLTGLTEITIPNSVTSIGGSAFSGCTGLTEFAIPNSITSIGSAAFKGCTGLSEITIPNSVTSIGGSAFSGCTVLKTVYFNAENCGDFSSSNNNPFSNCPIEKIAIGDNVKKIPVYFASGLTGLTEITIPNSVTSVGNYAFSGCTELKTVYFNAENCGDFSSSNNNPFSNCPIERIVIGDNVKKIPRHFAYGLTGLTEITIPYHVTAIGIAAFSGCTGLTNVTIGEAVTSIGNLAFSGCIGLTEITIPNSVTSIGSSAFSGCTLLKTVYFNAENCGDFSSSYNNHHPFSNCPIEKIAIGDNVEKIPAYFAHGLTGLSEITIPNTVTYIGNSAFFGCTGLKTVYFNAENCSQFNNGSSYHPFSNCPIERIVIGDNVEIIPAYFALGLTGLTEITIPNSVTSIGSNAFSGCTGLTNITIPNSVTFIGYNALSDCTGLKTVYFNAENCSDFSSYVHPFSNCPIERIVIGDNVEIIPAYFAYGLTGLSEITIPYHVTAIGLSAFSGCTGLTEITIPYSVTSIGAYAFSGCTGLTNVTIGDAVTSIGNSAFYNCSRLESVYCWAFEPPGLEYNVFYEVPISMCVYVPSIALEAYKSASGWNQLVILPMDDDHHTLTVSLPENVNVQEYANMRLEATNAESDEAHCYTVADKPSYKFTVGANSTWNVKLTNQYGDLFGKIEHVVVGEENVAVTFSSPLKPQDVSLKVKKPNGQDVTALCNISWFDEGGELLLQGNPIKKLPAGRKLKYQVSLPQDLATAFTLPSTNTYTVKDGNNNITCQLIAIGEVRLSGKVKDATNNQSFYGATVSAVQSFGGGTTKTLTATTDNQGQYSFDASTVPTTLTIAAYGYINQTIDCDMTSGNIVTVPDVALSPITGAVVNINLTYTPAHAEGEVVETQNWYSDYSNVDYEVYNKTTNRAISDIHVQYPQIVLMEDVNDGDLLELTATSRKNAFKPVKTTVTIAEQKATATFNIKELGKVTATFNSNINPRVTGTLYNAENKLVKTAGYSDSTLTIGELPDGNYQLVTMGKSDFFNSIYDLDQFAVAGLTEGDDYVKNDVQVNSGIISQVSIDEVPFFDESKFYYTGEHTSFIVNKPSIVVGNFLTFRAQLDFKEQYANKVSDVQLIVDLPGSCSFIDNSVMAGANMTDYSTSDNRITVPLQNWNDVVVRFCAIPTEIGKFAPSAFVRFKLNGKTITQPIGNAIYSAEGLTLNTVSHTSDSIIHVHGTVDYGHTVKIYDGNVLVGQTQCRSDGYWYASVNLYKPYTHSYHRIHAEIETDQGFALLTESKMVEYDKNMPQLLSITMCGRYGNIVFDQVNGTTNPPYYYNLKEGENDFTFIAKFSRNDTTLIKDLEFKILCEDRKIHSINGIFDSEENGWIARANFDSYGLPINVTVDYDLDYSSPVDTAIINASNDQIESVIDSFVNTLQSADKRIIIVNENEFITVIKLSESDSICIKIKSVILDNLANLEQDGYHFKNENSDIWLCPLENDGKMVLYLWNGNGSYEISFLGSVIANNNLNAENTPSPTFWQRIVRFLNSTPFFGDHTHVMGIDYYNFLKYDWLPDKLERNSSYKKRLMGLIHAKCLDGTYKLSEYERSLYDIGEYLFEYECFEFENEINQVIDFYKEKIDQRHRVNIFMQLLFLQASFYTGGVFNTWINSSLPIATIDFFAENFACDYFANAISDMEEGSIDGISVENRVWNICQQKDKEIQKAFLNLKHRIVSGYIQCQEDNHIDRDEDEENNNNEFFCPPVIPIHDPSGFVYEGVPSNRLQGVTTTCYYKETTEDMYGNLIENVVLWDAENYGQENPLITDENGYYRWDVPIGMWQVKYEKEGYETTCSDWLPVPPPQLDVNIGMVQMRQPEVIKARAYPKAVEFEFDKFMFPESLTTRNIKVTNEWGEDVSGTIELLNAEVDDPLAITSIRRAPGTGLTFASKVRFNAYYPFYGNEVTLHVSKRVKSYADLEMSEDYVVTLPIENEMEKIVVDTTLTLLYGDSHTMTVTVEPPIASNGKKLIVRTASPRIISTDAESYTLDNNGQAVVTVHGDLLGMTSLLFSVEGYDLSATTLVDVLLESQITVATPTASIASGSEVEKGTAVYLYCMTEGATIYYTLDGSCPCDNTPARKVYDGSPIIINDFMTIKAMAVADGLYDSDVATFVYRLMRLKGDVNLDGEVDIADINAVIDVILKNNADQGTRGRADVNNDGEVNIADINDIIDIILNTSHFTQHNVNCDDRIHLDNVTLKPGDVRTLQVTIDNATHYSAMQCDIILPEGLTLLNTAAASENVCKVGHLDEMSSRALTYSTNKAPFKNDGQGVLTFTVRADAALPSESEITLTNVVLADQENKAWHIDDCTAQVNNSSGINDLTAIADRVWVEGHTLFIETRQEGTAQLATINGIVYNITLKHGINQLQLEQGVYIVVINGNSHKIAIK